VTVHILHGDCRDVLPTLPEKSVHCVVTSPPYWGLRDYGTATWKGGDEKCDHLAPARGGHAKSGLAQPENGLNADTIRAKVENTRKQYHHRCHKCGAVRMDKQLGLEPTLAQYIANMVEVFRQVRRATRTRCR